MRIPYLRLMLPLLLVQLAGCAIQQGPPAAYLRRQGTATQLIVDGKPYLALAGELHNSSATSLDYMEPIWPKLQNMHLNTVLAAVTWEQIEPQEGHFDFSIVDGLLNQAREHDMRLILLWFGSWKNSTSRYTPAWVKADQTRFPLVLNSDGNSLEILSAFSQNNWQADATAYGALMRHVAQVDSQNHTVIMIQLENEVGVLGDSRDRRPEALAAFAAPVPRELMNYLVAHKENLLPEFKAVWEKSGFKESGSWEEVFGPGARTDEIFMAWNYARYCNRVSAAGKAQYPLPTYVNTWIVQPEDKGPGDYPSGGAEAMVHDVWRAAGSAVDLLAPDIYLPDFSGIAARWSRSGNPLFIPESMAGAAGAANAFYAFGELGAMGYSPFGIEERAEEDGPLSRSYRLLAHLSPLILAHQGTGTIAAASLNRARPSERVRLGDYTLDFELREMSRSKATSDSGYALAVQTAPDEYVIAGSDAQITFTPATPGPAIAGLAKVREEMLKDGQWIDGRWLNGDEVQLNYHLSAAAAQKLSGSGIRLPPDGPYIQHVKLYRYQ